MNPSNSNFSKPALVLAQADAPPRTRLDELESLTRESILGAESVDEVLGNTKNEKTGLETLAFASHFLGSVLFLALGINFIAKAYRNRKKVRFGPMVSWGAYLSILGILLTVFAFTFQHAASIASPTAAIFPRALVMAVALPAMFGFFAQLIKIPPSEKLPYVVMVACASLTFVSIAASNWGDLDLLTRLAIGLLPFLFSVLLAWLLTTSLGALSEAMTGKLREGFTIVVFTLIGGWFLYPAVNLLGLAVPNVALISTVLNAIDFTLFCLLSYGIYASVSSKQGHIHIKPAFGKTTRVDTRMAKQVESGADSASPAPRGPTAPPFAGPTATPAPFARPPSSPKGPTRPQTGPDSEPSRPQSTPIPFPGKKGPTPPAGAPTPPAAAPRPPAAAPRPPAGAPKPPAGAPKPPAGAPKPPMSAPGNRPETPASAPSGPGPKPPAPQPAKPSAPPRKTPPENQWKRR